MDENQHATFNADPFDLVASARVIVPITTQLLNQLPQETIPQGKMLSATIPYDSDGKSRAFAQAIYMLKCVEEMWLRQTLSEWWRKCNSETYDETAEDLDQWDAPVQSTTIDLLKSLGVRLGVAHNYQGYVVEFGGRPTSVTVLHTIALLTPDPFLPTHSE